MSEDLNLKAAAVQVGDHTFTTQQFASLHGVEVLTKLMKQLGPAIATLVGADPTQELAGLGPQLGAALRTTDPKEMRGLMVDMLAGTTTVHNGKIVTLSSPEKIDMVFSGKLHHLFEVFGHAVEVNFSDFFGEVLRKMAEKMAEQQAAQAATAKAAE